MKARWLLRGRYAYKKTAHFMGNQAVKQKPTNRSGYKIKKNGNFYDVYVYTTEKKLW